MNKTISILVLLLLTLSMASSVAAPPAPIDINGDGVHDWRDWVCIPLLPLGVAGCKKPDPWQGDTCSNICGGDTECLVDCQGSSDYCKGECQGSGNPGACFKACNAEDQTCDNMCEGLEGQAFETCWGACMNSSDTCKSQCDNAPNKEACFADCKGNENHCETICDGASDENACESACMSEDDDCRSYCENWKDHKNDQGRRKYRSAQDCFNRAPACQ